MKTSMLGMGSEYLSSIQFQTEGGYTDLTKSAVLALSHTWTAQLDNSRELKLSIGLHVFSYACIWAMAWKNSKPFGCDDQSLKLSK